MLKKFIYLSALAVLMTSTVATTTAMAKAEFFCANKEITDENAKKVCTAVCEFHKLAVPKTITHSDNDCCKTSVNPDGSTCCCGDGCPK